MKVTYQQHARRYVIDWQDSRPIAYVDRSRAMIVDEHSEAAFRAADEMDERDCECVNTGPFNAMLAVAALWKPNEP